MLRKVYLLFSAGLFTCSALIQYELQAQNNLSTAKPIEVKAAKTGGETFIRLSDYKKGIAPKAKTSSTVLDTIDPHFSEMRDPCVNDLINVALQTTDGASIAYYAGPPIDFLATIAGNETLRVNYISQQGVQLPITVPAGKRVILKGVYFWLNENQNGNKTEIKGEPDDYDLGLWRVKAGGTAERFKLITFKLNEIGDGSLALTTTPYASSNYLPMPEGDPIILDQAQEFIFSVGNKRGRVPEAGNNDEMDSLFLRYSTHFDAAQGLFSFGTTCGPKSRWWMGLTNEQTNSFAGMNYMNNLFVGGTGAPANGPHVVGSPMIIPVVEYEDLPDPPPFDIAPSAQPLTVTCGQTSQLDVNITGNAADSTIVWAPATGLSATNIPNPVARPNLTTNYTVTVSSGDKTVTKSIRVTVNEADFTLDFTSNEDTISIEEEVQFTAQLENPENYDYSWLFDSEGTASEQNPKFKFSSLGAKRVSLTVTHKENGCTKTVDKRGAVRVLQSRPTSLPTRIKLYPNPVTDLLVVKADFRALGLTLFDVSGREVMQTTAAASSETRLNVQDLAPGVYSLRITEGASQYYARVIKR